MATEKVGNFAPSEFHLANGISVPFYSKLCREIPYHTIEYDFQSHIVWWMRSASNRLRFETDSLECQSSHFLKVYLLEPITFVFPQPPGNHFLVSTEKLFLFGQTVSE
jgi:hypothetical protein